MRTKRKDEYERIEEDQLNALIKMTISLGKTPIIIYQKRTILFCVLFLAGKSLKDVRCQ